MRGRRKRKGKGREACSREEGRGKGDILSERFGEVASDQKRISRSPWREKVNTRDCEEGARGKESVGWENLERSLCKARHLDYGRLRRPRPEGKEITSGGGDGFPKKKGRSCP